MYKGNDRKIMKKVNNTISFNCRKKALITKEYDLCVFVLNENEEGTKPIDRQPVVQKAGEKQFKWDDHFQLLDDGKRVSLSK